MAGGTQNENRIIAAVIESGDIQPLIDRGVDKTWFFHADHRQVLVWLLEHYALYGTVPTWATLRAEFPGYDIKRVTESVDYLVDKQAEYCRARAVSASTVTIADHIEVGDFDAAIEEMSASILRVNTYEPRASRIVNSMEGLDEEWDDYLRRKAGSGMLGYTTGFPTIDKTTLGLQPGHLVTVLAQHKVGKTTLCLSIANHVYTTYEIPVLFCSFEMGTYEMRLRQRSLMARINFAHLQAGRLSAVEEKAYYDHLDDIETHMSWPFEFMDASSGSTVSAIHAQIQKREPKLVVIDGIYMLHDEVTGEVNTPQALTNVTRSLKRVATQEQVPILINTQALSWKSRGQKLSSDSAGYSSSFGQDSDVVLGLERYDTKDEDKATERQTWRKLRILASRNSGLDEVELTFDYDTGTIEEDV